MIRPDPLQLSETGHHTPKRRGFTFWEVELALLFITVVLLWGNAPYLAASTVTILVLVGYAESWRR